MAAQSAKARFTAGKGHVSVVFHACVAHIPMHYNTIYPKFNVQSLVYSRLITDADHQLQHTASISAGTRDFQYAQSPLRSTDRSEVPIWKVPYWYRSPLR